MGAPAGAATPGTDHRCASGTPCAKAGTHESSRAATRLADLIRAKHLQHIVVRPRHTPYNSAVPFFDVAHQTIIVLDFGSQFTQLIARRLRELSVYSEILPFDTSLDAIRAKQPVGIILSGGPKSVSESDAPKCDPRVLELGVPTLGICYGMQ